MWQEPFPLAASLEDDDGGLDQDSREGNSKGWGLGAVDELVGAYCGYSQQQCDGEVERYQERRTIGSNMFEMRDED